MSEVLTDLFSIVEFSNLYDTKVKRTDSPAYASCFPLIENLILCDKLVVERNGIIHHRLSSICSEFSDALKYIEDNRLYEKTPFDETHMKGYDIDQRAIVYADVARESDIYYSPHPRRESFISNELTNSIDRTATTVVQLFDQKFNESQSGTVSNIDVTIPPITEHVLYFSKTQNISLCDAINEVRNSKNARKFRGYISALDAELRDLSPRKKIAVYQPLFEEVDKLCETWVVDMDAEVKYRRRHINLVKIPIVGKLLEALGAGTLSINDPILFAKSPHLLFINDLYQR